jgi:hypothetical protein
MDVDGCHQPDNLRDQCINVCIRHPTEALQENPAGDQGHPMDEEDVAMDTSMDDEVHHEYYQNMELRTNLVIPNVLSEILFQQMVKQYPEQYINLFVDTTKCRLTRIDLSVHETKYPLQDQELISKLFAHPLRDINLSGCKLLPETLNSLSVCSSTLRVLDLSSVGGIRHSHILKELKQLLKLSLRNTDIGFMSEHMKDIGSMVNLRWLDLSCTSINDVGLQELLPISRLVKKS